MTDTHTNLNSFHCTDGEKEFWATPRELYEKYFKKLESVAFHAMTFAMEIHKDHKRRYTNNPYFTHLAEVAGLVSSIHTDANTLATAWLHDCVEDCGVEIATINKEFGEFIAEGVFLLSDLEPGNRKTRKELARKRLADAPGWVQDIKVCDMISNTSSIVMHDPKFAPVYLEEKRLMLEVLTKADKRLVDIARSFINE